MCWHLTSARPTAGAVMTYYIDTHVSFKIYLAVAFESLFWSENRIQNSHLGEHHDTSKWTINTLRQKQNRRHFADNTFKCIFLNENVWILITIWLGFVPKGPINNIPALVQIMAWWRPGAKPLSELMMVRLLTHICVTPPQWVEISLAVAFESLFWSENHIQNSQHGEHHGTSKWTISIHNMTWGNREPIYIYADPCNDNN